MSSQFKLWLPMVLCSAPGLVVALAAGVGVAFWGVAFVNSPVGLGLITLAVLACPLNMVLTMLVNRRRATPGSPSAMASCCMPGQSEVSSPVVRLAELRERRAELEHKLAELQRA